MPRHLPLQVRKALVSGEQEPQDDRERGFMESYRRQQPLMPQTPGQAALGATENVASQAALAVVTAVPPVNETTEDILADKPADTSTDTPAQADAPVSEMTDVDKSPSSRWSLPLEIQQALVSGGRAPQDASEYNFIAGYRYGLSVRAHAAAHIATRENATIEPVVNQATPADTAAIVSPPASKGVTPNDSTSVTEDSLNPVDTSAVKRLATPPPSALPVSTGTAETLAGEGMTVSGDITFDFLDWDPSFDLGDMELDEVSSFAWVSNLDDSLLTTEQASFQVTQQLDRPSLHDGMATVDDSLDSGNEKSVDNGKVPDTLHGPSSTAGGHPQAHDESSANAFADITADELKVADILASFKAGAQGHAESQDKQHPGDSSNPVVIEDVPTLGVDKVEPNQEQLARQMRIQRRLRRERGSDPVAKLITDIEFLYTVSNEQYFSIGMNWPALTYLRDVYSLMTSEWLTDTAIEACLEVLLSVQEVAGRLLLNLTHVLGIIRNPWCITGKGKKPECPPYLARLLTEDIHTLVIPLLLGKLDSRHWVVCTASRIDEKIRFYDSLGGSYLHAARGLLRRMVRIMTESPLVHTHWSSVENWTVERAVCPLQDIGDCGVQMIQNAVDLVSQGEVVMDRPTGQVLREQYLSAIKRTISFQLQVRGFVEEELQPPPDWYASNDSDASDDSEDSDDWEDSDILDKTDSKPSLKKRPAKLPDGLSDDAFDRAVAEGRYYNGKIWSTMRRSLPEILKFVFQRNKNHPMNFQELAEAYYQEPDRVRVTFATLKRAIKAALLRNLKDFIQDQENGSWTLLYPGRQQQRGAAEVLYEIEDADLNYYYPVINHPEPDVDQHVLFFVARGSSDYNPKKLETRCHTLAEAYAHRYLQRDPVEWDPENSDAPLISCELAVPSTSSLQPLLSFDRRIQSILNVLQSEARSPLVTFVGNGLDGLSTCNETWTLTMQQFPAMRFELVLAMGFDYEYDVLFPANGISRWATFQFTALEQAYNNLCEKAFATTEDIIADIANMDPPAALVFLFETVTDGKSEFAAWVLSRWARNFKDLDSQGLRRRATGPSKRNAFLLDIEPSRVEDLEVLLEAQPSTGTSPEEGMELENADVSLQAHAPKDAPTRKRKGQVKASTAKDPDEKPQPKRPRRSPFTKKEIEMANKLHYDDGKSWHDVVKEMSECTGRAITKSIQAAVRKQRKPPVHLTQKDIEMATKLRDIDNLTWEDAAKEFSKRTGKHTTDERLRRAYRRKMAKQLPNTVPEPETTKEDSRASAEADELEETTSS